MNECEIWLGEKLEDVNKFEYLGIVLCKHGTMEREMRERAVRVRQVTGILDSYKR